MTDCPDCGATEASTVKEFHAMQMIGAHLGVCGAHLRLTDAELDCKDRTIARLRDRERGVSVTDIKEALAALETVREWSGGSVDEEAAIVRDFIQSVTREREAHPGVARVEEALAELRALVIFGGVNDSAVSITHSALAVAKQEAEDWRAIEEWARAKHIHDAYVMVSRGGYRVACDDGIGIVRAFNASTRAEAVSNAATWCRAEMAK